MCHPKGLIVASLYQIIITLIIIIIIIIIITILHFARQFLFLLDQKKQSSETHKKPGKYVNFDLLAAKIFKGY